MTVIGDKQSFAFETFLYKDYSTADKFLTVDIYIANKCVTVQDNSVYVPQFLGDIEATRHYMQQNIAWLQYRNDLSEMNLAEAHLHLSKTEGWRKFLNWGSTTDDISCHLIVFQDSLWITFFLYSENPDYKINDPIVHGARLSPFDLISTLDQQCQLMRKLEE